MPEEKKKKVDYSSAWKEAREICLARALAARYRKRSDAHLAACRNGFAGFDEIYRRRSFYESKLRAFQMDRAGNRNFDFDSGGYIICSVADFGRGGAESDHRNAQARAWKRSSVCRSRISIRRRADNLFRAL